MEKKEEIKSRIKTYLERSDYEVDILMQGLTDEAYSANEVQYVNGIWDKCNQQRAQRSAEVQQLRDNLDELRNFQQKGSGSYFGTTR